MSIQEALGTINTNIFFNLEKNKQTNKTPKNKQNQKKTDNNNKKEWQRIDGLLESHVSFFFLVLERTLFVLLRIFFITFNYLYLCICV